MPSSCCDSAANTCPSPVVLPVCTHLLMLSATTVGKFLFVNWTPATAALWYTAHSRAATVAVKVSQMSR